MPFAAVNGQNLYYEDTGGTDSAIIFSHGLMMDHEMFAPQVEALSGQYRCITWDERGHGQTAGETLAPFSYYDSADDLVALLDYLGVKEAVLVGMSQGGFLSLRCALTHPEFVKGLVLIDTQAGGELPDKAPAYKQMMKVFSEKGLTPEMAGMLEFIILGQGFPNAQKWKDKWKATTATNAEQCFDTLVARDDITGRLPEISVPALVLHGDKDAAIPLERGQILADRMPNAELVVVNGAGHAANLSHPQPVNEAIQRFLNSLGAK